MNDFFINIFRFVIFFILRKKYTSEFFMIYTFFFTKLTQLNKTGSLGNFYSLNSLECLIFDKWFKLRASGDGKVKSLGGEKGLEVEDVKIVVIHQVSEQLTSQSVQRRHHRKRQIPLSVSVTIHKPTMETEFEANAALLVANFDN